MRRTELCLTRNLASAADAIERASGGCVRLRRIVRRARRFPIFLHILKVALVLQAAGHGNHARSCLKTTELRFVAFVTHTNSGIIIVTEIHCQFLAQK